MNYSQVWSRLAGLFTAARPRQEGGLPSLDGARGLAVVMVLLDHAGDEGMRLFAGADMNRMGKYGVYLFFVLSAFLLTYPFLNRTTEELRDGRTWANYFLRRFLRIFPLYAVVLVFFAVTDYFTWPEARDHLLLRDGQSHFWTIPVEFKFYFALPFLALALAFLSRKAWVAAIGTGLALWAVLEWGLFPLEAAWSLDKDILLSRTIQPFLLGSVAGAIYWLFCRYPLPPRARPWLEGVAVICLLAMLLRVPSVYEIVMRSPKNVEGFKNDERFCGVVWSIFLVAHLHGTGFVRRLLSWGPLCYLGIISYSAYLWHRGVLRYVEDLRLSSLTQLLVTVAILIPVATVTYLLIERPLSKVRLPPKPRPPRAKQERDIGLVAAVPGAVS